jgi:hypothetical protein
MLPCSDHGTVGQADYRGAVAVAVTGAACGPWAERAEAFPPADFPELADAGSACRNPGGARLGAWCFLAVRAACCRGRLF